MLKWLSTGMVLLSAVTANAQSMEWTNVAGGNWNDAANWFPANVPDAAGESAVINAPGTYTVVLNVSPSIDGLNVFEPNAVLAIESGRTLVILSGIIESEGMIVVNSTGGVSNSILNFAANGAMSGPGRVVLGGASSSNADAQITTDAGVSITNALTHTIAGSGLVNAQLHNTGLIIADVLGRELELDNVITQGATGSIEADGGIIVLNGANVTDGVFATANGGTIEARNSASSISSITNEGDLAVRAGATLVVNGSGLANTGVVTVNKSGGVSNATLRYETSGGLVGAGRLELNSISNDLADAKLTSLAGVTITHGANHTIAGSGVVDAEITNNGTIVADVVGRKLQIQNTVSQGAGGSIGGDSGTATLSNATISGGSFQTANGGLVEASVGTSTIADLQNAGDAAVAAGANIAIGGTGVVNNGTITVNTTAAVSNSILRFDATAILGGSGSVVLNSVSADLADAQLTTAAGVTGTNGVDHTISGRGRMDGDFVNRNAIVGDVSGEDLLLVGSVNQDPGAVLRGDAGFVALSNADITGGSFEGINGGAVHAHAGTNTLAGVTITGDAGVRTSATVVIDPAGITNNGTLVINTTGGVSNAVVKCTADAAITGNGTIHLGGIGSDFGDARLFADPSSVLTIGSGQTVTGRGRLSGEVVNQGTISPGTSADEINILDQFTHSASSAIEIELGGTLAGEYDKISGAAVHTVTSGATIAISTFNGYTPQPCDSWVVLTGNSVAGRFELDVTGAAAPPSGLVYRLFHDGSSVTLAVVCTADLTADCQVGLDDLATLLANYGVASGATAEDGDLDGDGAIGLSDLATLLAEYGTSCN